MFNFKFLLIAALIAVALCGDGKGKDGDWGKQKEKIKKCIDETEKLMECCPFPKNDEVKDDPDCKHHLEGIEKKEKKDQHKASSCFAECIFKKNELLNDKNELDKEKLKNGIGDYLEKNNAADFKAISLESIDLCITEFEAKKEKFEKWAAEHNKTGEGHHGGHNKDGEKKCSFYPEMVLKCMVGNVVRSCPPSKWQATTECELLKTTVTSTEDCMKH